MSLPVIPDVYRVTFNYGTTGGVTAHNVLHFRCTGNEEDLAAAIEAAWSSNMFAFIRNGVTVESLSILALDGTSAQVEITTTSPPDGQGAGTIMPAVAAALTLQTIRRGPRGRGRVFLGPVTEDLLIDGQLEPVSRLATLAAWDDFQISLQGNVIPVDLVVASYTHADYHIVTGFGMRTPAATLRRRQDQLVS